MVLKNYEIGINKDGFMKELIVYDAGKKFIISRYNILINEENGEVVNGQDYIEIDKNKKEMKRIKNGKKRKIKSSMRYMKNMGNYYNRHSINSNLGYIPYMLNKIDGRLYKKHHYGRVIDEMMEEEYLNEMKHLEEWCKIEGLKLNWGDQYTDLTYELTRLPRVKEIDKRKLKNFMKLVKIIDGKIGAYTLTEAFLYDSLNLDNEKIFKNIVKEENEEFIKEICCNFNNYGEDRSIILTIDRLSKMTKLISENNLNIDKLFKYMKKIRHKELIEYDVIIDLLYDYQKNRKYLENILNKKIKVYPDNLKTEEHKISEMYKQHSEEVDRMMLNDNLKKMKRFNYENEKFKIINPTCKEDLINEGKQQSNCVGSYYMKSLTKGKTNIVFMRYKKFEHTSFITIEVDGNNKITQAYKKHNNRIKDKDEKDVLEFIEEWAKEKNLKCCFPFVRQYDY